MLNLNKRYLDNMLRSPGVRGSSGILAEYGGEALFESASATAQRWEPHLAALEQYGESFFDYSLEGEKYIISRSYAGQYGICYYMFTKADELYTVPYTIDHSADRRVRAGAGGAVFAGAALPQPAAVCKAGPYHRHPAGGKR